MNCILQYLFRTSNILPRFAAVILLTAALVACTDSHSPAFSPPSPDPFAQPIPHAATQSYDIDIPTLSALLDPLFKQLHWGRIKIDNRTTTLHSAAIIPDGRTAFVRAQQSPPDTIHINLQIRIGYFGDTKLEQQFHSTLTKVIKEHQSE